MAVLDPVRVPGAGDLQGIRYNRLVTGLQPGLQPGEDPAGVAVPDPVHGDGSGACSRCRRSAGDPACLVPPERWISWRNLRHGSRMPSAGVLAWKVFRYSSRCYLWPSRIRCMVTDPERVPGAGDYVPLTFFFLAQSRIIPIMRDYFCIQSL